MENGLIYRVKYLTQYFISNFDQSLFSEDFGLFLGSKKINYKCLVSILSADAPRFIHGEYLTLKDKCHDD